MEYFKGIRSTLNSHAVMYSLTRTVQYEVLQSQITLLTTSDIENKIHNMNEGVFIEELTPVVCLAYLTWFSMTYFKEKQIKKLDMILDYKKTRTVMKASLFIFVYIFFRNVENAI